MSKESDIQTILDELRALRAGYSAMLEDMSAFHKNTSAMLEDMSAFHKNTSAMREDALAVRLESQDLLAMTDQILKTLRSIDFPTANSGRRTTSVFLADAHSVSRHIGITVRRQA